MRHSPPQKRLNRKWKFKKKVKVQLRKKLSVRLVCHHKPDSTNILQLEIKGKQGKERKMFCEELLYEEYSTCWKRMDEGRPPAILFYNWCHF